MSVAVVVGVVVVFPVVVFTQRGEVSAGGESAVVVGGDVVDVAFRCWHITAWPGTYQVFQDSGEALGFCGEPAPDLY